MTFDNLLHERDGAVAILTFNRPKVLNALNAATLRDLDAALDGLEADDEVRAIVLTGAGEKSFVAGADINELAVLSPAQGKEHARHGQRIFDRLEQLGKPVIAALNGFALGGGCELAMACTIRIAADTARLGQPGATELLLVWAYNQGFQGSQRFGLVGAFSVVVFLILLGVTLLYSRVTNATRAVYE